jgi:hypothetical protein
MKTRNLISAIILVFVFLSCEKKDTESKEFKLFEITDGYSQVVEQYFSTNDDKSKISRVYKSYSFQPSYVFTYDGDKIVTADVKTIFSGVPKPSITSTLTIDYNQDGQLVKGAEGKQYSYNANNEVIAQTFANQKDSLIGYSVFKLDNSGNIISEKIFDAKDSLKVSFVYEYDNNKNFIREFKLPFIDVQNTSKNNVIKSVKSYKKNY